MGMSAINWILLFGLSILWGGTFFFVAIAIDQIPPLLMVLLRVAIAAFALFVFLMIRGVKLPLGTVVWRSFLVMGFLNNVIPFSLFFWAQSTVPAGLASIANAATPVFSILIAHFCLIDERLTKSRMFGVLLAFTGVGFLFVDELNSGISLATIGLLACLLAACCQGFAVVYGRRFNTLGVPSTVGALGQLLATSVLMLPLVLVFEQPWTLPMPGLTAICAVIAMALFSTALAYVMFFRLLASAGAVNASLVTLLIPASAIYLGYLFLDEALAQTDFLGLGFILFGLLVIDGRFFAMWNKVQRT